MKVLCTLLLLFSLVPSAHALSMGDAVQDLGIVRLDGPDGFCTGALIGLKPSTVLTAGHCLVSRHVKLWGREPIAAFSEYDNSRDVLENSKNDFAVLIYNSEYFGIRETDLFTVEPIQFSLGETVQICGHKRPKGTWAEGPFCTPNTLAGVNGAAAKLRNQWGPEWDFLATRLKEIASQSPDALITTTFKDFEISDTGALAGVPEPGDSGGPWWIAGQRKKHVVGVSAFAAEGVYAVANKTQSKALLNLLQKAEAKGAKIMGLRELSISLSR